MAKARAIIKRNRAVKNIRKITRTMQLIATARFQVAFNRAARIRSYTERITRLAEDLSRSVGDVKHPLLEVPDEPKRTAHLVLTSNRGLCGGYNAVLVRALEAHLEARRAAGETVELHMVGKKGIAYCNFRRIDIATRDTRFEDKPQFAEVEPIAVRLMDAYQRREIDSAYVTYTRFISTSSQRVETMKLLPIEQLTAGEEESEAGGNGQSGLPYEFSPGATELLQALLPETVKVRLFQCFIDAAVSEQVARMVAMKAATDAAGDMIRSLTNQYNRARQSQITLELLDIVGGAEALA